MINEYGWFCDTEKPATLVVMDYFYNPQYKKYYITTRVVPTGFIPINIDLTGNALSEYDLQSSNFDTVGTMCPPNPNQNVKHSHYRMNRVESIQNDTHVIDIRGVEMEDDNPAEENNCDVIMYYIASCFIIFIGFISIIW